jgi:hypothetical protein
MEVDRGQQVAMPATAIEEEEDRTLGLVWSCFIHERGGQLLHHFWNWSCIALAFFLVPLRLLLPCACCRLISDEGSSVMCFYKLVMC